jgi:hypothetical protein
MTLVSSTCCRAGVCISIKTSFTAQAAGHDQDELVCSCAGAGAAQEWHRGIFLRSETEGEGFPPELACATNQDRHNFVPTMEVDTNKKSKQFGNDQLVAQSVRVIINNVDRVVDLNRVIVYHLFRLCKKFGHD